MLKKLISMVMIVAGFIFYSCTPPRTGAASNVATPTLAADELSTADERIEKIRKGDVTIQVVDANGNPVPNSIVKIKMVRHAFLFGCNIAAMSTLRGADLKTFQTDFSALFNYATLPFFWDLYEKAPGSFQYDVLDPTIAWCKANRITMKGHPLVWHRRYPDWAPHDPQGARLAVKEHVTAVVSRYRGVVDRWDVVNEAIDAENAKDTNNGISNWLKADGLVKAIGETMSWARAADPKAVLLINQNKATDPQTVQLFADLIQAKKDVDIIGLQSHMLSGDLSLDKMWSLSETYSRLGKPVDFTELTVISGEYGKNLPKPWPSIPEGEARQARYLEQLYTLLFSHPRVGAITFWGLRDGGYRGAPGGLLHEDLSPKPAYTRLLGLIKGKWWTNLDTHTDARGSCTFRGFLGDYQVTVTSPKGQGSQSFTLQPGENHWTMKI